MAGILKIVRYSVGEMRPMAATALPALETRLVQRTPRVPVSPALPALLHTPYTHTQSHNRRPAAAVSAPGGAVGTQRSSGAAEQRSRGRLAAASEARPAGSG